MNTIRRLKEEKGFALVLSIVIMAAMTAIGLAAITTSNTEMLIARNQVESRTAFYLAEIGIEEAIARMDLKEDNSNHIGETNATKENRIDNPDTATLSTHNLVNNTDLLGLENLGGTYTVDIAYARESVDTWCRDDPDDATDDTDSCANNEILVYCVDFIGVATPGVPGSCERALPIYVLTSEGETTNGAKSSIRSYVTSSMLNVVPPGNTILFSEGSIYMQGAGGITGDIASYGMDTAGPNGAIDNDCVDPCFDVSSTLATWNPPYGPGDMDCYIGLCIMDGSINSFADYVTEHTSASVIQLPEAGQTYGEVCSTSTADDWGPHACDGNESVLVVIDNGDGAGGSNGAAKLVSNTMGRGILVVTGDLELGGGVVWEGMIYVMGKLKVSGTNTIFGTAMIQGDGVDMSGNEASADVYVVGSLNVYGSVEVATSVLDGVGMPKVLRWSKI